MPHIDEDTKLDLVWIEEAFGNAVAEACKEILKDPQKQSLSAGEIEEEARQKVRNEYHEPIGVLHDAPFLSE